MPNKLIYQGVIYFAKEVQKFVNNVTKDNITVTEQYFWYFRSVGDRFDMAKSSLSRAFFRIVKALNNLAIDIIKWPSLAELPAIKNGFSNISITKRLCL